jgi:hypothetical protein
MISFNLAALFPKIVITVILKGYFFVELYLQLKLFPDIKVKAQKIKNHT